MAKQVHPISAGSGLALFPLIIAQRFNAGSDDKKETKSHQGRKNGSMKHSVVVLQTMLHRPARFFRPSRGSNILGLGFPSVKTLGYFQDAQYAT